MAYRQRVILTVSPHSGFHRGLLRGIWQFASESGRWIFLRELQNPLWNEPVPPSLELMQSWRADGAISERASLHLIGQLQIPTIACPITGVAPGFPTIVTDDRAIGQMAAEHLSELGLRHFACCGFDALGWSNVRADAFSTSMEKRGAAVHRYQQSEQDRLGSWMDEEPRLRQWLSALPKPIGIFCTNDDRAALVAECCRLDNLRIPLDVAILGVDDDQYICELLSPALSSIALSTERAGYEAAALLDAFMSGAEKPAEQRIVVKPTRVAKRASTDVFAVTDPKLTVAMQFIRDNSGKLIQVSDVANHLDISTRLLEQRFRQQCGCTVLSMIHRTRAQHIARLLATTNRSIGDIAYDLGYSDQRHIARFFSRIMGLTPQAYREQTRLRTTFRHRST